jgi:hypothetical protein
MAKKSVKPRGKTAAKTSPRLEGKAKVQAAAKPPRKAAAKSAAAKPAGKQAASTPADDPHARDSLDALIEASAVVLDLPVDPQWLPAIKMNLQVTLRQAALVTEFALPDDAEPAPVFEA